MKNFYTTKVKLVTVGDDPERKKIEGLCHTLDVSYEIIVFVSRREALKGMYEFDVLALQRVKNLDHRKHNSIFLIKIIEAWTLGIPVLIIKHKTLAYMGIKDLEHVITCKPDPNDIVSNLKNYYPLGNYVKNSPKNSLMLAKKYDYSFIAKRIIQKCFGKLDADQNNLSILGNANA